LTAKLTGADAKRLASFTAVNAGKQILIMLDGVVASAPMIYSPMENGLVEIACVGDASVTTLRSKFKADAR
jgi:preprotein translocase subunit SecD